MVVNPFRVSLQVIHRWRISNPKRDMPIRSCHGLVSNYKSDKTNDRIGKLSSLQTGTRCIFFHTKSCWVPFFHQPPIFFGRIQGMILAVQIQKRKDLRVVLIPSESSSSQIPMPQRMWEGEIPRHLEKPKVVGKKRIGVNALHFWSVLAPKAPLFLDSTFFCGPLCPSLFFECTHGSEPAQSFSSGDPQVANFQFTARCAHPLMSKSCFEL